MRTQRGIVCSHMQEPVASFCSCFCIWGPTSRCLWGKKGLYPWSSDQLLLIWVGRSAMHGLQSARFLWGPYLLSTTGWRFASDCLEDSSKTQQKIGAVWSFKTHLICLLEEMEIENLTGIWVHITRFWHVLGWKGWLGSVRTLNGFLHPVVTPLFHSAVVSTCLKLNLVSLNIRIWVVLSS